LQVFLQEIDQKEIKMLLTNEFTEEEIKSVIPDRAYSVLTNLKPSELDYNFVHKINIDNSLYNADRLFAYSFYQSLTKRQRACALYAINNLTVGHLLHAIGMKNPELFDRIEQLDANGHEILDYLERQIEIMAATILSFDQQLESEGK